MELRQLRYLLLIAEAKNFTRAAEKGYVTQSALSQQMQNLEQEVGTVLLERSKRGVRLTAAGEILCHYAARMLNELEQAQTAIHELEGLQRGELHVGVVQTVNAYFVPTLVTRFADRFPNVKLHIHERANDDIESGLESGELQVAIGFVPPTNPEIDAEFLFEERLALVVRADHPLAQHDAISVAALDGVPMVMLAKTFCTRRLWEDQARLAGAQPKVVLEMNTVSSILSVIVKTGLATVLPELTLMETPSDAVVTRELRDPTPVRQVGIVWSREAYRCAASRAFHAAARETTAEWKRTKIRFS